MAYKIYYQQKRKKVIIIIRVLKKKRNLKNYNDFHTATCYTRVVVIYCPHAGLPFGQGKHQAVSFPAINISGIFFGI